MIWGCVGWNYKSKLVILPAKQQKDGELRSFRLDSSQYIRRCLSAVSTELVRKGRIFQQDGARSHVSKQTLAYLKKKKLEVLEKWPPYSPDLSPIERIWHELQKRVGERCPMTTDELIKVAQEEWEKLPMSLINKHVKHFATQVKTL
jgi:transposase